LTYEALSRVKSIKDLCLNRGLLPFDIQSQNIENLSDVIPLDDRIFVCNVDEETMKKMEGQDLESLIREQEAKTKAALEIRGVKPSFETEGIDRIGVLLNPLYCAKDAYKKHKDPTNTLTLHQAGAYTQLSIHAEWFNPSIDYQWQIALALYGLVLEGVINFPDMFPDTPRMPYFIYTHPYIFIRGIVACELYSDFKEKNIEIHQERVIDKKYNEITNDEEEVGSEIKLVRYYDEYNQPTETYYSTDYNGDKGRKSTFICYNKQTQLIHDNNKASRREILARQNPYRCEMRLTSANSEWLNWDNLQGNFKQIFSRNKPHLAVVYNNYVKGCITVRGNENPRFLSIVKAAVENNNVRYKDSGHKLKRERTYNKEELYLETLYLKEEMNSEKMKKTAGDYKLYIEFSEKRRNIVKAEKMDRYYHKNIRIGREIGI
jgi:hypothetical protein